MSKSIVLSPKHGVNASMMVCPLCHEDSGIALLGRLKGDAKVPKKMLDQNPCEECQGYMKQGIIIIETKDDDREYRMGGWIVVKDQVIKDIINDPDMVQSVLEKRVLFMPTTPFRQIFGDAIGE